MKSIYSVFLLTSFIALSSCSNAQNSLSAGDFSEKIKVTTNSQTIDVRTPDEFKKGHLANAKNINWNSEDFASKMNELDKTKPVFVYCLSGGRSSAAAEFMRSNGFRQVYELDGGIMKWRAANLPETTDDTTTSAGMSKQQFETLLDSEKLVLIDFYADWCAPCKKMKPYLEEIAKEMAEKVTVIRINADDNQLICKELQVDALPVLQLYKNKKLVWSNVGFIEKEAVIKQLQ